MPSLLVACYEEKQMVASHQYPAGTATASTATTSTTATGHAPITPPGGAIDPTAEKLWEKNYASFLARFASRSASEQVHP